MRKHLAPFIFLILLSLSCATNDDEDPELTVESYTIVTDAHHFINFGTGENQRKITLDASLPQDPSLYHHIDLKIKLDCPMGGCDPWDRLASLSILTETDTVEIARYITPYGIGCEWTTDVTAYRELLSGEV